MEWRIFLAEQANAFNPTHNYLAQIALEIRRSFSRRRNLKLKDFLIRFISNRDTDATPAPMTADDRKAHINKSKSMWKQALGIGSKKKKKPRT